MTIKPFIGKYSIWGIALFFIAAVTGAMLPESYYNMHNSDIMLASFSVAHPFGTDMFGRDMFWRIVRGSYTVAIIVIPSIIIGVIGGGIPALFLSKKFSILQKTTEKLMDFLFAFPLLLFVLVAVSLFQPSHVIASMALGVFFIPVFYRILYMTAQPIWQTDYIHSAIISKIPTYKIVYVHIFPNIKTVLLGQITVQFAMAILAESVLGYLGLSQSSPDVSWGTLLYDIQNIIYISPYTAIPIGIVMTLTIGSFIHFGDSISMQDRPFTSAPKRTKTQSPFIECDDVSLYTDSVQSPKSAVLQNISLTIKESGIVVILGKSGSGKSSLLKAISAIDTHTTGTLHTQGRMDFIYQNAKASLSPVYTILQQSLQNRTKKQTAKKWFEHFKLSQKYTAHAQTLSGGQHSRCNMAVALTQNPDIILLDEPTANLDTDTEMMCKNIICEYVKNHNAIAVWVTHNMALAQHIADRIIVMENSSIAEDTPASTFFKNPQSDMGKKLCNTMNVKDSGTSKPYPEKSSSPICILKDVECGYKNTPVIKAVSLSISAGQIIGISGESGTGKTTILRTILGQIPPVKGHMHRPQSVQMIYQNPVDSLNPMIPIYDTLYTAYAPYFTDKIHTLHSHIVNILEMVGIESQRMYDKPHQFSGGQCQRICIARAIGTGAELILADEITAGLDPITEQTIMELLSHMAHHYNIAVLCVSHNQKILQQYCHNIYDFTQ